MSDFIEHFRDYSYKQFMEVYNIFDVVYGKDGSITWVFEDGTEFIIKEGRKDGR